MPKGFAHPYLMLAVVVIIGAGAAVLAGNGNLVGLVLGTRTQKENVYQNKTDGLNVTVISPKSSWDLVQYLCSTREECEKSPTSGKWWATVSGAPTGPDGHEVFIQRSDGWGAYPFIKVYAKSTNGAVYRVQGSTNPYFITETTADPGTSFVFVSGDNK